MVTAIVIPIICLYFYYLTKKEMKVFHDQWISLDHIHEEAVVTGEVLDIYEEKQRFYHDRYIHCLQITLQSANSRIVAKKLTPIKTGFQIPNIKQGEVISVYGNWESKEFIVSRIQKEKKECSADS